MHAWLQTLSVVISGLIEYVSLPTILLLLFLLQALRLSSRARRDRTIGEIVNLMSVDAERLKDVMSYFHSIWSAPLQIVLAIIFLWFTMGPSIFVGVMVLLILIPLNTGLAALKRRYQVISAWFPVRICVFTCMYKICMCGTHILASELELNTACHSLW